MTQDAFVQNDGTPTGYQLATSGANLPTDNGLLAWTFDLDHIQSQAAPTAGVVVLAKMKLPKVLTVANLCVGVGVAGVTLANCYAGLFDASGTQLGVSADVSSSLTSTGFKELALTGSGLASIPQGYVYGAILVGSAGTLPQWSRGANITASILVGKLGNSTARHSSYGSSLTAMPSSLTMGSASATGVATWMGLT